MVYHRMQMVIVHLHHPTTIKIRNSNSSLYALMVYHRMQMVFVHLHHPTTIKIRNSNRSLYALMVYHRMQMVFVHLHHPTTIKIRLRSVPLVQWYQVTASPPLQPTAIPNHQRTFLLQSLAVTAMGEKVATIT